MIYRYARYIFQSRAKRVIERYILNLFYRNVLCYSITVLQKFTVVEYYSNDEVMLLR